eukprot:4737487-Pleurochrysis_carterae.AAC.3
MHPCSTTRTHRHGAPWAADLHEPDRPIQAFKVHGQPLWGAIPRHAPGHQCCRLHRIQGQVPHRAASYLVRNQGNHGCNFDIGALYNDNEIVLNSAKVDSILKDFDMLYHINSCKYEPWQNPTERHMRKLQEPMRVMHERGGAGEECWAFPYRRPA